MNRIVTTTLRSLLIRSRPSQGNIILMNKHMQISSLIYRQISNDSTVKNEVVRTDKDPVEDIPEEEFVVAKFARHELVPEKPISSLNIEKRIEKLSKQGSFSVDLFTGSYDHDFLTYPDPLNNRGENQWIKDQAIMVRQLYPQMWDDDLQLQKYNFFNLYQLSITEMMSVFESIGYSSRKCFEGSSSNALEPMTTELQQKQFLVSKAIISLITRNCLTYWPIYHSENDKIKSLLPKKHIYFGGDSADEKKHLPIGFCWTEQAPELGSLPPQEWLSYGQHGGPLTDHHLLVGKKTHILHEDSTEHYLVYYRDKFLTEKFTDNDALEEPNPASDTFVGCCLLNKSELRQSQVYSDAAGFKYTDVEFNVTVPGDRLVFAAERKNPHAVNIKGLGQLATCSVTLGILKDTLARTYRYLLENKRGILDCDIIERKLAIVTTRIFAIESMIYYIAGMYDGLEPGFDAHLETTIVKVVTNEYAYQILQELQQVCGSQMYILSRLQDQVNVYDSFLDGNIYNRLYLATMGVLWYARSRNMHLNQLRLSPWYPGYFLKHLVKERSEMADYLTLNADIYGNLHPSLKEAAVNLEYILKRVKYATDLMCMKHGKDVTAAQSSLYRLAQLSIDSFMLTTICARASKSYSNGSRHAEIDVGIATTFSFELARKVRLYMEEIQIDPAPVFDVKAKTINELNMKQGGYYAESPLDPNI